MAPKCPRLICDHVFGMCDDHSRTKGQVFEGGGLVSMIFKFMRQDQEARDNVNLGSRRSSIYLLKENLNHSRIWR